MSPSRIGVLALQGGYAVHRSMVEGLGHEGVEVRTQDDLDGLSGLILPGGESTTQLRLIKRFDLADALDEFVSSGRPVLGTCAGLILSAQTVTAPEQISFGWLNVEVSRNGWGRQVFSFEAMADDETLDASLNKTPMPLLFIRAPRITAVGAGVEVLARFKGEPILVRHNSVWGATFHPELSGDDRIHQLAFGRCSGTEPQSC